MKHIGSYLSDYYDVVQLPLVSVEDVLIMIYKDVSVSADDKCTLTNTYLDVRWHKCRDGFHLSDEGLNKLIEINKTMKSVLENGMFESWRLFPDNEKRSGVNSPLSLDHLLKPRFSQQMSIEEASRDELMERVLTSQHNEDMRKSFTCFYTTHYDDIEHDLPYILYGEHKDVTTEYGEQMSDIDKRLKKVPVCQLLYQLYDKAHFAMQDILKIVGFDFILEEAYEVS